MFIFDTKKYFSVLETDVNMIFEALQKGTPPIYLDAQDYVYKYFYNRKYLYEKANENLKFPENFFEKIYNPFSVFSKKWNPESPVDFAGRLIVNKLNYERKILTAGSYLKQDNYLSSDIKNEQIQIQLPNRKLIDSYIHFWGSSIGDEIGENKNTLRFYFNFKPEANDFLHIFEEKFARDFFRKLNRRKIPFHIKFRKTLASYYADSTVLYLERRYLISFLDVLYENYNSEDYSIKPILREETPMFTYPILSGIGFAEGIASLDSGLESFGLQKTNLIVSLCQECVKANLDKSTVINLLTERYRGDTMIFLNESSRYEYNYSTEYIFNNVGQSKSFGSDSVLIGYSVCKEAFWDDQGRCNWVGFIEKNKYVSLGVGYLDGLGGILLFLTELFDAYDKTLFKRYGIGTIKTIIDKIDKNPNFIYTSGYHGGIGSTIYILHKAVKIFELEELFNSRLDKITHNYISTDWSKEIANDVFGGLSGSLLSLLLIKQTKTIEDPNLTQSIKNLVDEIIKRQDLHKVDIYINTYVKKGNPNLYIESLTGLAHGFTGIAYVLAFYQKIMNCSCALINKIIDDAIVFEHNNRRYNDIWIDATISDNGNASPIISWELGLLGAAYSRIGLMNVVDNTKIPNYGLLEQGLHSIVAYCNKQNIYLPVKINKINDGTLDFLSESIKIKSKTEVEATTIFEPIIDLFNSNNLELISPNLLKIEKYKNFVHPGLIGESGLGLSKLRLEKSGISSYILPS